VTIPDRLIHSVVVSRSSITLAELSAGPLGTDDPVERAARKGRLQRVEASFHTLPFDAGTARPYGPVYAAVRAAGRTSRRRFADLLTACVAISNALPLYTSSPQDYVGLDHLLTLCPVSRPAS
jgi:predicted nucleic acid-binding protein